RVDALFVHQCLVEMAVGAFERPDKRPLLGPAFPLLVLLLHLHGIGLVVANARGVDHVGHAALLWSGPRTAVNSAPRANPANLPRVLGSYAIAAVCAIAAPASAWLRFPPSARAVTITHKSDQWMRLGRW